MTVEGYADDPCPHCGLKPILVTTAHGTRRVDGCFGGLLEDVISACCGHGGEKPAYIRVRVGDRHIDVCGGQLIDYCDYTRNTAGVIGGKPCGG